MNVETSYFVIIQDLLVVGSGFWLGGSDVEVEGDWRWVDGSNWDFQAWDMGQGQPNNYNGNQHCLTYKVGLGNHDDPCTRTKPFLCRSDAIV